MKKVFVKKSSWLGNQQLALLLLCCADWKFVCPRRQVDLVPVMQSSSQQWEQCHSGPTAQTAQTGDKKRQEEAIVVHCGGSKTTLQSRQKCLTAADERI